MDYAQHFTGEIAARLHEVPPDVADMGSWFAGESTTRAAIAEW